MLFIFIFFVYCTEVSCFTIRLFKNTIYLHCKRPYTFDEHIQLKLNLVMPRSRKIVMSHILQEISAKS